MIEPTSTWSSDLNLNLAMLSYSTGLAIPRITSPWLLRTKIGILLFVPIQIFVMIVVTIPGIFMELALGQYSNRAMIKVWDLCPVLRGIGIVSFFTFLLYQMYSTFLCTCTLCFTFLSIGSDAPWKSCNRSWNKINCYTLRENYTRRFECNQKLSREKCERMTWQSSVEQFYFYRILNIDDSGYVGTPQQELLLYALITTVVVFFANYGGPKSTEKFLIVLAVVPTIQLLFLFFAPLTDSNGFLTLHDLFTQFDKTQLRDPKIWMEIVQMSLVTPGLGFGAYTTLGTHSSFRHPLHLRVIVISLVSACATILYSVALQNFLVSLCLQTKMLRDDFFDLEKELAMPQAVFFLEHSSKFWISMWLSNSYMLGLRSLIVMMSINAEVVYNTFPTVKRRRNLWVFFFSVFIYSGGVFFSTRIGHVVVKTIDKMTNTFMLLFLNILQVVGVAWFYGLRRFKDDVHFMLGIRPSRLWNVLYTLHPILLTLAVAYGVHDFYRKNPKREFPWIYPFESVLLWMPLGFILVYALTYALVRCSKHRFNVFRPSSYWGPRHPNLAKSRYMFKAYNMAKEYLYRQHRFQQIEESEL